VQLQLPVDRIENYRSASQRARVATEAWAAEELFCPSCPADSLDVLPANTRAHDFACPRCNSFFQLKSQSKHFGTRIVDAEYHTMLRAIREDRTPNLLALEYSPDSWKVANLFVIPHFAFSESMVEMRKPLAATARRAGWTGCNLLLGAVAPDARISYVSDGKPVPPKIVREQFAALRPLETMTVKERGWTLDVLNAVCSLQRSEFTLPDVYAFEHRLGALHPDNHHVREKIRQQLQILRKNGFLDFTSPGRYELRPQRGELPR
jgi:type II restriction enzyme